MKKALLVIILILTMTSCSSTFYYSILDTSTHEVEKIENGDFLFETDSLWIAYNFYGEDAPVKITVYNKLNKPLYIDWKRSSLIMGGVAHPYKKSRIEFVGDTQGSTYESVFIDGVYRNYGTINAFLDLPEYITFIPPNSMVVNNTINLGLRFDQIKNKEYKDGKLGKKDGEMIKIKRLKFGSNVESTVFSSYLSLYYEPQETLSYTTDFYLTDLFKVSDLRPRDLPVSLYNKGDVFYQQKRPNNTGWKILAGTAMIAGAIAVDVILYDDDDCHHCH